MFKPLAIMMGLALMGASAGPLSAQVSVKVNHGRGVEVKVGRDRDNGRDRDRRDNDRRDNERSVKTERVWVEDFADVEERYFEPGHFVHRDRQIWIEEKHVDVVEQVWVPERHVQVEEQVYVAGQHVTTRVAKRDRHGCIYYVNECKWVPAHYETRCVTKCIPGHYENRTVCKVIPGHYKTVCEKVWIEGCYKTRTVRKCIGGHWEVRACR